ncbi:MAG: glycosyltransferase family 39 protein [candidate division NC10 bacterium]|nr:glycosyltransferase family 39 protein [candidate division NC10 bacterium]
MNRASRIELGLEWVWFLAWGLASSVWCITAAGQLGATFDEPFYLARGLEAWRTGSYAGLLKKGTMPLPIDVTTLPVYLWERWHGIQFDPLSDLERILPWARAGTLLFWWLLLAYGWRAGRHLAGPWGGRLAVALLASEPSLLAHASLATTDIAVTACLLALVYHFRTGREAGWVRRLALPTFWFAASVLAKASALVYGPLCLLAVEVERLARAGAFKYDPPSPGRWAWFQHARERLRPFRRDLLRIATCGLILVVVYCGSDWSQERSFVVWAHSLPEGTIRQTMIWLSETLRIFSNAGEGLVQQIKHNIRGHGVYLLGQIHRRALWYYFPVALTIKLSLPLQLLPLTLLAVRPRALLNWASVAASALLVFSLASRVQIGIRLVLPLVALAAVGLAAATARATAELAPGWRKRLLAAGVSAGVVWTASAALTVWPHALSYTNELWGGTEKGYLLLSDSNYDWGQGVKELARWHRQHGLVPMDVWYFGTDPALSRLPVRNLLLQAIPINGPEDIVAQVRGRYLAVSTTLLYGAYIPETRRHHFAFLRARPPAARTTTFLIYDFTQEPEPSPAGVRRPGN